MKRSGSTGQRLAAIFLMGGMLLNYPILSLPTGSRQLGGIPLLYAWIFGVWILLVVLMAIAIERPGD